MLQAQHALSYPSAGNLSHKNTRNNLMCITGNKREECLLCKFNQKVLKWFGKLAEYNIIYLKTLALLLSRGVVDWLGFVQHRAC